MRIISGQYRRRKLHPLPKGVETRPVPDMVREAFFNLLRGHFEDATVIDVFSGSGSIGLEAASLGASRVVCVERDRKMAATLEKNIEMLGCEDRVEVAVCDALGPATLSRCPKPVHIVFMDPPYPMVWDAEGWPRIKKQFERLISMMDDTGYAIIRTPWPLYRRELIEDEDGLTENSAKSDSKGASDQVTLIDGEEMVEIDPEGDWLAEWESEASEEEKEQAQKDAEGGKRKYRTFDISIDMDGAIGPETHVYGTTAIHLYMKKTEAHSDDA